ncbi:MAG TPA: 3-oxoacyl-[acyl-carrier-protein] synthase III C-terminal domain-containing protein [Ignavibacteria bacterium]|nr:3-oxoacyl-[acyl-carrier-protein] synthase III C-terminal domain-containing protein [Ignavibacteria bacterium]
MPKLISVKIADLPNKVRQSDLKEFVSEMFSSKFKDTEKLLDVFENTQIKTRNMSLPVEYFYEKHDWQSKNDIFIVKSLEILEPMVSEILSEARISLKDMTDIFFVSSTGISTPTIDAMLINKLGINEHVNRYPMFGLGCAGGVSGLAKAFTAAKANPDAVILVIAIELCTLTFIKDDISKSNFIATSLFSDGAAVCLLTGDNVKSNEAYEINYQSSLSKIYPDSLDVMGWEVINDGLKVVFSRDIPEIVKNNVAKDLNYFLEQNKITLRDIKNFIIHPGGVKVIKAYIESLKISEEKLKFTSEVMMDYGNMSSVTVLYVLNKFLKEGFEDGYGVMLSLGPGFSSEMLLLNMKN